MEKSFDIEFEKAVRMLAKHFPESKPDSRKPVLFHDIRVGTYLYEEGYSRDVVLSGLLHDALEWSDMTEEQIKKEFGEKILQIVKACTKDRSITDSDARIEELAKRCAETGKDALIVKAADTIDSFKYYTKSNNESELDYCMKNAKAVLKYVDGMDGEVFGELGKWAG